MNSGLKPTRSRDCSRPRTAQQLSMTIEQVNGKMLQTFQCSRRPAAELNRRAFPTGFRQAFTSNGRSASRGTGWRATDSGKAATEDLKDCNRSGTPESRSCELCNKALTMLPCERRQRLHHILNDFVQVATGPRAVTAEIQNLTQHEGCGTSHGPLRWVISRDEWHAEL